MKPKPPRLMIIDPYPEEDIARWLRKIGFEVDLVRYGREAVEEACGGGYDVVVVCDFTPDISQADIVRQIREWDNTIGIIVVTPYEERAALIAQDWRTRVLKSAGLMTQFLQMIGDVSPRCAPLLKPVLERHRPTAA